jgi:hypothetical protein
MPFSFVCSDSGIGGVSGIIRPAGEFQGTSLEIGALDNSSFNNWGSYKVLARNYTSNPTAGNCLVMTPGPEDGVIRAYAFTATEVLTNLWRVPDGSGNPIVPVGTTYSTTNEVINACASAGCIYFDQNGPDVVG